MMKKLFLFVILVAIMIACKSKENPQSYSYVERSISMSSAAQGYLTMMENDLGASYFTQRVFDSIGRQEIMAQDPSLPFPTTKPDGSPLVFANTLTVDTIEGYRVYSLTPEGGYDQILFYIHGGAYVYDILAAHLITGDTLATRLHAKVVFPQYPLAFISTFETAYAFVEAVYTKLLTENKRMLIGGDSAGGGFALAFTEYLKTKSMTLPSKMILFSPWVDITNSNPDMPTYEKKDLALAIYGIAECGKMWAGTTDCKDYRVSPLYGDLNGLPDVLLFVGDAEIMYPDNMLLAQKLKDKTNVTVVVGKGLFHGFSIYYFLPEAKESWDIIQDFV